MNISGCLRPLSILAVSRDSLCLHIWILSKDYIICDSLKQQLLDELAFPDLSRYFGNNKGIQLNLFAEGTDQTQLEQGFNPE